MLPRCIDAVGQRGAVPLRCAGVRSNCARGAQRCGLARPPVLLRPHGRLTALNPTEPAAAFLSASCCASPLATPWVGCAANTRWKSTGACVARPAPAMTGAHPRKAPPRLVDGHPPRGRTAMSSAAPPAGGGSRGGFAVRSCCLWLAARRRTTHRRLACKGAWKRAMYCSWMQMILCYQCATVHDIAKPELRAAEPSARARHRGAVKSSHARLV